MIQDASHILGITQWLQHDGEDVSWSDWYCIGICIACRYDPWGVTIERARFQLARPPWWETDSTACPCECSTGASDDHDACLSEFKSTALTLKECAGVTEP